ncbi:MAG: BamA/TamA family outer membrane protein, partial [Polyangiaceae bacterium]
PNAAPISDTDVRDLEIDLFRGFLSGGPSDNRGYPTRTIGLYTFVPFFNPSSVANQVRSGAACVDTTASGKAASDACRTPVGGMSMWEASAELRILISGPLSEATFCDSSDVSPEIADIRINHPHISCGAGARYDTPVGPIRLDVGYRIPGLQYPTGDPLEPSNEQVGTIFGAPVAISAGIGEAF